MLTKIIGKIIQWGYCMVQVIERKGLDIVRRDWSLLAKELGDFCLTQILSGGYVTYLFANLPT